MFQNTIAKKIELTGIGLHSGKEVKIRLTPEPACTGILFYLHTKEGLLTIKPEPNAVQATELATTIKINEYSLSTVEHLLAAIQGLEIDNIGIHINCKGEANEIPILDGSAHEFVQALKKAERRILPEERLLAKISKTVSYQEQNKSIIARPYNGLFVDYRIDFPHSTIGKQRLALEITRDTFEEIAYARTFGFLKEVEYLHSKGLALGGSLENAIVLDDEGVINPNGLRCPDEFVRHKILDFLGDIALFGLPLQGYFEISCSGHQHNNKFLHTLIRENAFTLSPQYNNVSELVADALYTDAVSPVYL